MRAWIWWVPMVAVLVAALIGLGAYWMKPSGIKPIQVPRDFRQRFDELARTNHKPNPQRAGSVGPGLAALSDAQRADVRREFAEKLRPALLRWAAAYSGHIPFDPQAVTVDNFYARMHAGNYASYTFMIHSTTLVINEVSGAARVEYLNTPATGQLMALPSGASPDMTLPITKDEIARMIKADSGEEFSSREIRIVPTAASSAVQGGGYVIVGGDMANAGSWLYTMTFGPDKMLSYYMRGPDVLWRARR